jgi:hypothetical protein
MLARNDLVVISRTVNIAELDKRYETYFRTWDKLLQSEGNNEPQLSHDDLRVYKHRNR